MIVKFTGVNKRLFFWHNDESRVLGQTLISERMKQNHYLQNNIATVFWKSLQQQEVDYLETENRQIHVFETKWNSHKKSISS